MTDRKLNRTPFKAALLAFGLLFSLGGSPTLAQDAGGMAGEDEMRQKVVEIERLMRQAEALLARSLDRRRARDQARASKEEIEKLLDQKAQESAGQSAEALRKLAQEGSSEAAETLRKLTEEATREATETARKRIEELMEGGGEGAAGAAGGIRKILEESQAEGQRSKELLEWILEQARKQEGSSSSRQEPKPQEEEKKPEEEKQPTGEHDKPENPKDPPQDPPMEKWLAQLPGQVRKAYEAQDWDSIPPRWRALLRAWTRKMAEDLEQEQ